MDETLIKDLKIDVNQRPSFGSHSFVLEIRCLTCKTELGFAQREQSSNLYSQATQVKKEEDTLCYS